LPTNERDVYRKLAADRLETLQRKNNTNNNPNPSTHIESKLIRSIRTKLNKNNAMITRADKGNSIVILPTTQYDSKIQDFLKESNFLKTNTDPTKTFQAQINKRVRNNKTLIPKENRWKYTNLNPSAPTIKGLIKIHKTDQPIRLIVNWRQAPA
jgi:hypothetical protein